MEYNRFNTNINNNFIIASRAYFLKKAWFIVMEVDTSMMIILVMWWNTSTIAHVWPSWFCHKFVMDVHAWQKSDLLWQTRIITEVYFLVVIPLKILFTFIYFLANFYIIFGTNLLIQCPVPVPVCCMFYVSQNIHIKRSPNGIKRTELIFGKYGKFRKKNPRETVSKVVTR